MKLHRESHPSIDDLLLALDGELTPSRAATVSDHLAACATCQARRDELGRTSALAAAALRQSIPIPPEGDAGALLRERLRGAAESPAARLTGKWGLAVPAVACAGVAAATLLTLAFLSGQPASAGPLPDARLTPGATRRLSRAEVCVLPSGDEGRTIPSDVAQRVFHQYRIATPRPRAYEVDYLISPALGGTGDIRNLWPVPYSDGMWTSRVKDALEDHLRRLVCEGRIELTEAQQEIAADWIAAYRKHFRTSRPLAAHVAFTKDSPWE